MKKLYLLIILLSSILTAFSQRELSVFFYSGEIGYKNQEQDWKMIDKLNLKLIPADSIHLSEGSQLFLIKNKGDQVLISKAGKYPLEEVITSLDDEEDIIAAYTEFVWEEFNHPHKDLDKYADKYMREKGGVSRAANIPEIFSPFAGSDIIDDYIYFSWKNEGAVFYTLSFWDSDTYGRKLFELSVKDTMVVISTSTLWLPKNEVFYWSVTIEGQNPVNYFPIAILGKKEKREIEAEVSKIEKNMKEAKPELIWLVLASFYEKNDLLQQAKNAYMNALDFSLNDKNIKEYYKLFLARIGEFGK